MAIDWSLLGPPVDIGGAVTQGFERGRAMRQRAVKEKAFHDLAMDPNNPSAFADLASIDPGSAFQVRNYARQEKDYARQDQVRTGLAGALRPDGTLDPTKAMAAYVGAGDVEGAQAFRHRETQDQLQHLDMVDKVTDHALQLLGGVHDQASWDSAKSTYLATLQQYGLPAPQLPAEYSPETVRDLQMQSLSTKEQIEAHKGVALHAGDDFIDPYSGAVIASKPAEPKWVPVGEGGLVQIGADGQPIGMPQYVPGGAGSAPHGQSAAALNNPGGIKDSAYARSQPGYKGSQNGFAIFDSPQSGARAQEGLLRSTYLSKPTTIADVIERYAPRKSRGGDNTDEQVNNYIAYVAQRMGMKPTQQIDGTYTAPLAKAMREFETGHRGAPAGHAVTQEEYSRLPKGAHYTAPDGSERVKG